MTSVAKDSRRIIRFNHNQNHNKHHTPGININYLIFLLYYYPKLKIIMILFSFVMYFYFICFFILYDYTWCMVFVMNLVMVKSDETCAAGASGIICLFVHCLYSFNWFKKRLPRKEQQKNSPRNRLRAMQKRDTKSVKNTKSKIILGGVFRSQIEKAGEFSFERSTRKILKGL